MSIRDKAAYWSSAEIFDYETRREITSLITSDDQNELSDRFYKELELGTGGLRGIIGAGSNRMNIYNVRKATFALANFLQDKYGDIKKLKVAITYDCRNFSREFAEAAAGVLASCKICALITTELRPVPILSYMIRHYQCQGGICITASHNPAEYNGFKIYGHTGGQVVPPDDNEIIKQYQAISSYETIPTISYEDAKSQGLIQEVSENLDNEYFKRATELSLNSEGRENFTIVFSPLHGTGGFPVLQILRKFGFSNVVVVPEQADPDGDFPTVTSPNPEDHEANKLALKLAEKEVADIVLTTDPDTDRLSLVSRENDDYVSFNGNQIGSLLMEYILSSLVAQNRIPANPLVIKTIVTTDLQRDIAEHYKVNCEETLTGFKWIGDRIEAYESGKLKPYREFVFGGEESYGFLAGTFLRDKDAVSGCALAAEMTAYYKYHGLMLSDVLDKLYTRHGVYLESLHTMTLSGQEGARLIERIMESLRLNPPDAIGDAAVESIKDYQESKEWGFGATPAKKSSKDILLPKSNVLQIFLNNGSKISIRPSGTEPKLKLYYSVHEAPDAQNLDESKALCKKRLHNIYTEFGAFTQRIISST